MKIATAAYWRRPGDPMIARIEAVVSRFRELHSREAIAFDLEPDDSLGVDDSSVNGLPFLPEGEEIPLGEGGRQLTLLAQFDLARLPANHFLPRAGILQFWITCTREDGGYGAGSTLYSSTNQETFRVRFFPDPALRSRPREEVQRLYRPDRSLSPVETEAALRPRFMLVRDTLPPACLEFEPRFLSLWNELHPEEPLGSLDDLNTGRYDTYDYAVQEMFDPSGHKLGGFPGFTQPDPREGQEGLPEFDHLLLQLDTDEYINWGDCGVGDFLIPSENLRRADFSQIFYTWDCG